MKNKTFKVLALLLVLVMALTVFAGCKDKAETTEVTETETTAPEVTAEPEVEAGDELPTYVAYEFDQREDAERTDTPLVVGYQQFNEKFSPFFSESGYDADVAALTQVNLLSLDRQGGIVYNAIEGETIPYNGTDYLYTGAASVVVEYDEETDLTTYLWTLRDDVQFSDGEYATADDIIFSYYVLIDPSYDGSATLYSTPILGVNSYRLQISEEALEWVTAMDAAGKDNTDFSQWTEEQQNRYYELIEVKWKEDVQAIVDYCYANYFDYYGDAYAMIPQDLVDIAADTPGIQIAAAYPLWGFGGISDGVLTGAVTGTTFDLVAGEYPTLDDYFNEIYTAYDGDVDAYAATPESPYEINPKDNARDALLEEYKDEFGSGPVLSASGIEKLNDYQVRVTVKGFDATAIYKLGIQVAPMHYYGDASMYDYENGQYGFPFGDLTIVKEKTTTPMGAGPYTFIKYENKVVYFESNPYYYKGEPLIKNVQFKETEEQDVIPGVNTGTIDIGEPSFGDAEIAEIKSYNSNGELDGDVIDTVTVDNLGYGFIGINANTVAVGDPASDASKNLRKAFATLFSVYRDSSVASYYGDRASIINYPISNTSWAAPQKADDGYEIAFSTDVDGNAIYTSDMDQAQKYEAALEAAKGFLMAAGFTYDEASGMFTAAPEGAKMSYSVMVGGSGQGAEGHPVFELLDNTSIALASIGIELVVRDIEWSVLQEEMDTGEHNMVAMAWGATVDPDMYQIYHSMSEGNDVYFINDPTLDQLILDARTSPDQSYRKAVYKECLDIILDWAVEIPTYQRQNCNIFSAERINVNTLTPDITTFWTWSNDIELLEMN